VVRRAERDAKDQIKKEAKAAKKEAKIARKAWEKADRERAAYYAQHGKLPE
jgi:hypothetical protein